MEHWINEAQGDVLLAKINIDENPSLAQMLRIQSVPTVMAFFGGQPVTAFTGVKPQSELKHLIAQLVALAKQNTPEAFDIPGALTGAAQAMADGDLNTAHAIYAQILQMDETHIDAFGGMVRVMIAAGQIEQAQALMTSASDAFKKHSSYTALLTALELAAQPPAGPLDALKTKVAQDPQDMVARYDLAHAEFTGGDADAAIDTLLSIIRTNRTWNGDAARVQLLKYFDALGFDHPAAIEGRKKLSRVLFS